MWPFKKKNKELISKEEFDVIADFANSMFGLGKSNYQEELSTLKLPKELEKKDNFNIITFLKNHSYSDISKILEQLPIEILKLDSVSVDNEELNDWVLALTLDFANIFSIHEWNVKNKSNYELPDDLPAKEYFNTIVPRFIDVLKKQNASEILPSIDTRLRILAQNLHAGHYIYEALEIFKTCKKVRHLGSDPWIDFWIFICLYNIAHKSNNQKDIKTALDASKNVTEPEKYMKDFYKLIDDLNEWSK